MSEPTLAAQAREEIAPKAHLEVYLFTQEFLSGLTTGVLKR
jgi:hypothetical protein